MVLTSVSITTIGCLLPLHLVFSVPAMHFDCMLCLLGKLICFVGPPAAAIRLTLSLPYSSVPSPSIFLLYASGSTSQNGAKACHTSLAAAPN